MATVLVIGSGGREHAVAWKLAQSPQVARVHVSPGNGGTSGLGGLPDSKLRPAPSAVGAALASGDFTGLSRACLDNSVDLVFVGPEEPLSRGLSDALTAAGVAVFGPTRAASELEYSKAFAKAFMVRHGIPTPRFVVCEDATAVGAVFSSGVQGPLGFEPLVAKASGLAAGKGVVVAGSPAEAAEAARELLERCGAPVLLEERLSGPEVSLIGFTDGERVAALPPARDRKRRLARDLGPNTGGMGAVAPMMPERRGASGGDEKAELDELVRVFLQRAVDGMRAEGKRFVGALYAGLMRVSEVKGSGQDGCGFVALEYNCRLGDPETQALMPLLDCDLYQLCLDCVHGRIAPGPVPRFPGRVSMATVLVQSPYPAACPDRHPISGLETFANQQGDPLLAFHAGTALPSCDGNKTGCLATTSGGRVCSLVAIGGSLADCRIVTRLALGAGRIRFSGAAWREDVAEFIDYPDAGGKDAPHVEANGVLGGGAYAASGVNVAEGDRLVSLIRPLCSLTSAATAAAACLEDIGSFGAPYRLAGCGGDFSAADCPDPVLVSGVDGVGTKLLVAESLRRWGSVGVDLVAMCANDVICRGARPLFFLDTYSCGRLNADVAASVVSGVADGCLQAGCALVGGETAEMPGMYARDESVDLVGCCVGLVDRARLLPRFEAMSPGDPILGLVSSGLHSNGYSLARRLVGHLPEGYATRVRGSQATLGEELLTPTRIYAAQLAPLIRLGLVTGLAHVTGGGITGNLPRCLPPGMGASVDLTAWRAPPLLRWLMSAAGMDTAEACATINCGLGMLIVAKRDRLAEVVQRLPEALVVGELTADPGIHLTGCLEPLSTAEYLVVPTGIGAAAPDVDGRVPLGVLISGSGTNLQALLDYSRQPLCPYRVALVVSNVATAPGLARASAAGVPAVVLRHGDYPDRGRFDAAIVAELRSRGVTLVAFAGFMRIVTRVLLDAFPGRVLNTHPSLLPAFKGAHAHRDVLAAGVRVTGCTVHFVVPEIDAGPVVLQAAVPVTHGDTEETLAERVKRTEHRVYPMAVAAVSRGDCRFEEASSSESAADAAQKAPVVRRCVWQREPPAIGQLLL